MRINKRKKEGRNTKRSEEKKSSRFPRNKYFDMKWNKQSTLIELMPESII
jgi:hypothetical protein